MTSQGHTITRLRRLLAAPNSTLLQIRAAAAELQAEAGQIPPGVALAITLAVLDREPALFSRTASRLAGRWLIETPLQLVDAQLLVAAFSTLPTTRAPAGAEALIELSERFRLAGVEQPLVDWLRARGLAD